MLLGLGGLMAESTILKEGLKLYTQKNYTGALTYFLSLPSDANCDVNDLSYYIGLCYTKLARYDDALLYIEQVVTSADSADEKSPRILQCRYLLAVIYCLSGRTQMADFELNKLLEIDYKPASVYSSLAYVAWENNDVQKCIDYYEKALDEDENNLTALNGMGYVLANEERDLTKALMYCKKALSMSPESPACLDSVGWVYFKMGLYSEAKRHLEKAYKNDKNNSVILEHMRIVQRVAD